MGQTENLIDDRHFWRCCKRRTLRGDHSHPSRWRESSSCGPIVQLGVGLNLVEPVASPCHDAVPNEVPLPRHPSPAPNKRPCRVFLLPTSYLLPTYSVSHCHLAATTSFSWHSHPTFDPSCPPTTIPSVSVSHVLPPFSSTKQSPPQQPLPFETPIASLIEHLIVSTYR